MPPPRPWPHRPPTLSKPPTSYLHRHPPAHHQQQLRTIASIQKTLRPPSRFNLHPSLPIPLASPAAALARREASDTLPLRSGALATKKGMTALYDPSSGKRTPCTVLQMDRVQVVGHKTRERHGYWAVVVGSGWREPRRVGRAMMGVWEKVKVRPAGTGAVGRAGVAPKRDVREFRVRGGEGLLGVGETVGAEWFSVGQWVDAKSHCRGMGFAGGMKRWGFKGQGASHGVSLTHRAMGSAGGSQGSGSRVHPGKKMAGRMGGQQHTVQNLKVLFVDQPNGLVVVNGAVSGPKGCLVKLQDALKKPWPEVVAPVPLVERTAAESLRAVA